MPRERARAMTVVIASPKVKERGREGELVNETDESANKGGRRGDGEDGLKVAAGEREEERETW